MELGRLSKFTSITMLEPDHGDKEKKVFIEYLPGLSTHKRIDEALEGHVTRPNPVGWIQL